MSIRINMPNLFNSAGIHCGPELRIVKAALELSRREPFRQPLQILDAVIGHLRGHQLDYEFDDEELRPPHPFADLLLRAFAAALGSSPLTPEQQWTRIVLPFARRYRIWEPDQDHAPSVDEIDNVKLLRTRGNRRGHPA